MNKLITSAATTLFVSADQLLEIPVVENSQFESFEDSLQDAEIEYMSWKDLASFNFMLGFVERSIDLSENAEELRAEGNLNLEQNERYFMGSEEFIYQII